MKTSLAYVASLFFSGFTVVASAGESQYENEWLDTPVVETVGSVEFRHCILESQYRRQKVQCAYVDVLEQNIPDKAEAPSKTIKLFIARIVSPSAKRKPDPLVLIAGGPGQAASEGFVYADHRFPKVFQSRDIYLIDQRGTGRSNKQSCDDIEPEDISSELSKEEVQTLTSDCLKALSGDPRWYTTSVAIRDFEQVRSLLAIEQWNILGVSYGTRVAQHYMRMYPEALRTVVLDSVVPVEKILGPEIPLLSQLALDQLATRCQQDVICQKHFPGFKVRVAAFLADLKTQAIPTSYEDTQNGGVSKAELTWAKVAAFIRLSLYNSHTAALLPAMLHQAYEHKNYAPLIRNADQMESSMKGSMALGMHSSVMCAEDAPFMEIKADTRNQLKSVYMGDFLVDWLKWTCELWPQGFIDASFKSPVVSSLPTLLLSGEFDPITPPSYAESVVKHLPNAKHFIAPGHGHFVSVEGCMPTMVAKFIDEASVSALNSNCLSRMSPAPIFVDFNGPSP